MKKLLVVLMTIAMMFALVACNKSEPVEPTVDPEPTVDEVTVMSHADYVAAELDTEVTVECYVQAHQGWWDEKVTVYAADEDGAYFIYNMACSQEDSEKLTAGTKIRVTGFKSEWSGEVEITDATFEIVEGSYVAEAVDVTDLLASEELIDHQNEYVSFTGLEVVAANDAGDAFMYNWDGSGDHDSNSDLYFNVTDGTNVYQFTVESYLTGNDTDVYAAVEALNVGDVVDMTGFLYWYNGVNPHIVSVVVK